jgi:hypothetical protein
MQSEPIGRAAGLSDSDLLRQVALLATRERGATVELVGHLAELDARKLHVAEGYGSLFAYCTGPLRLAEHAAYNRIEAARLSRRFPVVLDLLSDGTLNLSTLRLLAPHLRPENFETLVNQARLRSKREVETLVAQLAPRPDVPASVRRLPERRPIAQAAEPPSGEQLQAMGASERATSAGTDAPTDSIRLNAPSELRAQPVEPAEAVPRLGDRPVFVPLSPGRYSVRFTMTAPTHDKLRRAQELLRREVPDGNPDSIIDRALTLLLEDVARRKLAVTSMARTSQRVGTRSRHIPAQVRRAVWLREGGRCAFVSALGRRCNERAYLEFHHREPYAIGGEATVANISLRCRAHNVYEAKLAFGPTAPQDNPVARRSGAGEVGNGVHSART